MLSILGSLDAESAKKNKELNDYTKQSNSESDYSLSNKFKGELNAQVGAISGDPMIKARAKKIKAEAEVIILNAKGNDSTTK